MKDNPYVGPRAFSSDDPLFGRDREIAELTDLLVAERIVLLYSPSGAGKTSLIEAGLRGRLEKDGFSVLPTLRVSCAVPVRGETSGSNRYSTSVLLRLDQAGDPASAASTGDGRPALPAALDRLMKHEPGGSSPQVIVLDQFEEVLTLNPADQAEKAAFFKELGEALRNRNRWALFAMREEYLAALDPYLRHIPTRLSVRYRLDLLGRAAALQAIVMPAKSRHVEFTKAAADLIFENLCRVRVPGSAEASEWVPGPHVEPVQLQVVCRRLWDDLPEGTTRIDAPAAERAVADFGGALGGYYNDTVAAVSRDTGVNERRLRDWFDRALINQRAVRTQVPADADQTMAVKAAIPVLLAAHLIREEKRRIGVWYELAHDRLIEPVRASNQAWYGQNATFVERKATLWDQGNRPTWRLLNRKEAKQAAALVVEHPEIRTKIVDDFLTASTSQQQRRTIHLLVSGMVALTVLMTIVAFTGFQFKTLLDRLRKSDLQAAAAVTAQRAEASRADEAAQAAGRIVQQTYGANDDNFIPVEPTQSLRAYRALERQRLPPGPIAPITIHYFTGDLENERVRAALKDLGFDLVHQHREREDRVTNAIWYGSNVSTEDVKRVALALIRGGFGLQSIRPFELGTGKENIIEIGSRPSRSRGVLTVDEIEQLSPTARSLFAPDRPSRSEYEARPSVSDSRTPTARQGPPAGRRAGGS